MPPAKVVDLIYPKENLRHKDIPLPDFEKIHEQMIQMGKHADLSFLWIDYKKEHPNGYQLAQFYKLYRDFMVDTYGTSKTSMPVERIPGEKMYIDWVRRPAGTATGHSNWRTWDSSHFYDFTWF